ncbi:unnamed protein product [marine sediment metagenome]|uniref:16S rRNA (Cytosine(1402)-N(4))-methyltransferase n=1 Tax=marine sediment metagenome TaxID=412755 RepID=X1KZB5_9ZZZZ
MVNMTMSLPTHIPVLVKEAVEGLQAKPGGCFIDCTVGMGGHAAAILESISPQGKLLGIDADPEAIRAARAKLGDYKEAVILANDSFANLNAICKKYDFYPVDGILFDLGISSMQLDTALSTSLFTAMQSVVKFSLGCFMQKSSTRNLTRGALLFPQTPDNLSVSTSFVIIHSFNPFSPTFPIPGPLLLNGGQEAGR